MSFAKVSSGIMPDIAKIVGILNKLYLDDWASVRIDFIYNIWTVTVTLCNYDSTNFDSTPNCFQDKSECVGSIPVDCFYVVLQAFRIDIFHWSYYLFFEAQFAFIIVTKNFMSLSTFYSISNYKCSKRLIVHIISTLSSNLQNSISFNRFHM